MTRQQVKDEAVASCRKAGIDPFEVIPVGPPTRMQGDRLVDGDEVERWILEIPEGRRRDFHGG
jgi:hypothetical protein